MNEVKNNAPRAPRERSPSFPNISLKVAIERLVAFEAFHKRTPVAPDRVGPAWDMKPGTSLTHQLLAALKAYGLIESQKGQGGVEVVISNEGRNYLRAQQEEVRRDIVRRAALLPKQIQIYWERWGKERPNDAACLDELVIKASFSPEGADRFLRIYDETIRYAGLLDSDKIAEQSEVQDDLSDEAEEELRGSLMSPHVESARGGAPLSPPSIITAPPIGKPRIVMNGGHLDIHALVDLEGLKQLQSVLKKYEEILEMMAPSKGEAAN
ncbi:hypothetical protein [Rhodoblastus sp.]|uniref:hypothetical protein n=1 Tax=Rhodoblastus sp. TaxID=1962975 RepID=UPI003F9B0E36